MLSTLVIKNLALIRDLTIEFAPGLNVVTGETGTGKSIIIGALQLILGQRADRTMMRTGADCCEINVVVELADESVLLADVNSILSESGVPVCEDGQLLVGRRITGKTVRNYVNSTPVTLQLLSHIGDLLVDVHGPYDHQSLLHPAKQLEVLDAFAGSQTERQACADHYRQWRRIQEQIVEAENDIPSPDKIDVLRYQLNEIRTADLQAHEDNELTARHALAANGQRIVEIVNDVRAMLGDGEDAVADQLSAIMRRLHELEVIDENVGGQFVALLDGIIAEVRNLADEINTFADNVELDPRQFARIEERLAVIQKLKRKYGSTFEKIIEHADYAATALERMENFEAFRNRLQAEEEAAKSALLKRAGRLSKKRRRAAARLAREITGKLKMLGFKDCGFTIAVEATEPGPYGCDAVEFSFAPNIGEGTKSLRSIASSGEISRVMLAVKTVLAAADSVPVLVFDEIDANIGGVIAAEVGNELRALGNERQVICITHLPQVAAGANQHFRVEKKVQKNRTSATVVALNKDDRIGEIARMLGGANSSTVVMKHAEELVAKATS